ncbi:MAG: FHA domain-containing protein [Clostridium sp.]|nr:FHA domain-containing protein [Clostridium sp.]MCM1207701.1 FHA domain-containing protein [Ruminococcus sp.]
MKVIKCKNHHFYDSDKFSQCPKCGEAKEKSNKNATLQTENEDKVISEGKSEKKAPGKFAFSTREKENMKNSTRHIFGEKEEVPFEVSSKVQDEWNNEIEKSTKYINSDMGLTQTLCGNVDFPYGSSMADRERQIMFAVGWLICIDGPNSGCCYPLHENVNTVGRSINMDVRIDKDDSVSREEHFKVIYDARNVQFILYPNEKNKLTYCNNELVLAQRTLNAYDLISAGNTILMFMPLCGPYFTWQKGKGIINYDVDYNYIQYEETYENLHTENDDGETTVLYEASYENFICPICGKANIANASYCEQCGKDLQK